MSMSLFQTVLSASLLLLFSTVPFATPRQSVKRNLVSVTINSPEVTVHVGQTQKFEAVDKGTCSSGITMDER